VATHDAGEIHPERNPVLKLVRRLVPVTADFDGQKLFTRDNGRRMATPLFVVLVLIEATDVVFAVDSVPASFGVANDPFTILAANAFAIMGLRAMYFLLADARERFHYLSHALGGILLFVGIKLSITPWYHIDIYISLAIIVSILVAAIFFSIWKNRQESAEHDAVHHH
jgi:tellurite resistance protein TerC